MRAYSDDSDYLIDGERPKQEFSLSHYLKPWEYKEVADALYHEGFGQLPAEYDYNRSPIQIGNIPNLLGPTNTHECLDLVKVVLMGTYRGDLVECDKPDCYCH